MAKKENTKKPIYDVNWYDDKYQAIVVFRNWMLLITLVSIVGIFAMTMASYYFVPLKSVSPFVIQIDEKTGVTQVVDSQNAQQFTTNDALIKYYAYKYILARETYNFRTFQENMETVRLMSTPEVMKIYRDFMYSEEAPYKKFGASVERRVALISIQPPRVNRTSGETSVQAKFKVSEISAARAPTEYIIEVEVIGFFDPNFHLTEEERFINPLSFTVTYYTSAPIKES